MKRYRFILAAILIVSSSCAGMSDEYHRQMDALTKTKKDKEREKKQRDWEAKKAATAKAELIEKVRAENRSRARDAYQAGDYPRALEILEYNCDIGDDPSCEARAQVQRKINGE
jgi:hypothetical protein